MFTNSARIRNSKTPKTKRWVCTTARVVLPVKELNFVNSLYDPQQQTYRYRPRGMNDGTLPYGPYSEVTGYEEQEDGTLKLYVEAVWERRMNDLAVSSELVVRPLADGSFQYVSNHVTSFDEALAFSWYEPRLTEEEWQYYYGDS